MRREVAFVLLASVSTGYAIAQQAGPATPSAAGMTRTQAEEAVPPADTDAAGPHKIGGRISAPVVLHQSEPQFSDEARRAKYQGTCVLSLIVDARGNPQNIRVVQTLGMGLDEKAIEAVSTWRFKPALKDGTVPVPVMITVQVDFHLYNGTRPNRSAPAIKSLPGSSTAQVKIKPPVIMSYVEPEYSDYGRKNRIKGDCVIGLTVAADGIPHDVHVIESLEPSLDENAVAAVRQWVYRPATKDGQAVPFEGSVKIKFKPGGKLF